MPLRDQVPYLTAVLSVMILPVLVSPNFIIGCMVCLHYFSFSVMEYKGCFVVWGIFDLKTFYALFCLTHSDIVEVSHAVSFFCMYLT